MSRVYPELAPLQTPIDTGVRPGVLVQAACVHCGQLIQITLTATGAKTNHAGGCHNPTALIGAITWPNYRPMPPEAD